LRVFAEKLYGNGKDEKTAFSYTQEVESKIEVVARMDFTSQRKAMSTLVKGYKNENDLFIKGAPDRIIAKSTKYMSISGEKEMTNEDRQKLNKHVSRLASQGLRCLALAEI